MACSHNKSKYQVGSGTSKPMKTQITNSSSNISKTEQYSIKMELQNNAHAMDVSAIVKQSDSHSVKQHSTLPNSPISESYDIIEYSEVAEMENLCIGCGINMGKDNPRQYCHKTYCPYEQ